MPIRPLAARRAALAARMRDDEGSMPLAMALMVFVLVAAVAVASSVAAQVGATRSEMFARTAAWNLDSTLARAGQALMASDRLLTGIPTETPATWTTSEDGTYLYRWWAQPLDRPGSAAVPAADIVAWASDGTRLLAVTANSSLTASTDGATWTRIGPSPLPANRISAMRYTHGKFVLIPAPKPTGARAGDAQDPVFFSTTGGYSWAASAVPGLVPDAPAASTDLDCSASACVLLQTVYGTNGVPAYALYLRTTNLHDWTVVGDTSASTVAIATRLTYGNGLFVAVGGTTTATVSRSATDGVGWTPGAAMLGANQPRPTQVVFAGSRFLALTAGQEDIATSSNGLTWTASTPLAGATWTRAAVRADASMIALLGTATATDAAVLAVSRTPPPGPTAAPP